jgi:hypothetical protein
LLKVTLKVPCVAVLLAVMAATTSAVATVFKAIVLVFGAALVPSAEVVAVLAMRFDVPVLVGAVKANVTTLFASLASEGRDPKSIEVAVGNVAFG